MSEIPNSEKSIMSQNSKGNASFYGTEQIMNEYEGDKSNLLAKSIEKRVEEEKDNFNINSLNESGSFIPKCSEFTNLTFFVPLYIMCSSCKQYFNIKSLNLEYIDIECKCRYIKNCPINEFKKRQDDGFIFDTENIRCKLHSKNNCFKKFIKYCKDCKKDLCETCLEESALYNNDSGTHKIHETHDLINLNDIKKVIEETRALAESLNFEKKHEIIDDSQNNNDFENDEEPPIKKLILDLLKCYKERHSYSGYKAIKIAKSFLSQPFNHKTKQNLEYEELIKINSIKELKENIDSCDKIYKIIIDGEETKEQIENFNIMKNKNFSKLVVMQINNIKKLKNIKALVSCSFPELRKLIIGCSELDDKCIKVIKNLKLPKIKFISFFGNKISSPKIFGAVRKFKTLEKYYIGFNNIDVNKLPNKNIIYNFPKNLVELGISKMFNKDTNSFITEHLNLENIKLLFVSGNEIVSLKPYEKIEFKQLEEFWIRGNEKEGECLESIEDIKYLQSKNTIKKIVVKQNNIKDVEKLVDIIFSFPNLEIFNIEHNGIEKEKMEFVINKIKEKGSLKKLKFKYN